MAEIRDDKGKTINFKTCQEYEITNYPEGEWSIFIVDERDQERHVNLVFLNRKAAVKFLYDQIYEP
jgi:hypothetical protein